MKSIRKFVGRGALVVGLSGVIVLAMASQPAQAARTAPRAQAAAHVATPVVLHLSQASTVDSDLDSILEIHTAPSAQCTAAVQAFQAARAKDKAEDSTENALANVSDSPAEQSEDAAEKAAIKPQLDAVRAACAGTRKPPTTQCQAAVQALKAAKAGELAEDQSEKTDATEGTSADRSEDQAEMARLQPLFKAVFAACRGSWTDEKRFNDGATWDRSWTH